MFPSQTAPWLNYYGRIPHSIDYPEETLYGMIAKTAKEFPQLPAYEFMNRTTDYKAFLQQIDRAAGALSALGIGQGDRVTICMPNSPQALHCFYALNKLGAVSSMIHPLSARQEITFYLDTANSKAILTLDRFYSKVRRACDSAKRKPLLLIATIQEELNPLMKLGYALTEGKNVPKLPKDGSYILWKDALKVQRDLPEAKERSCRDCACILFSGGTTGTAKGICLSDYNFNALALQTIAASGCKTIEGLSMLSVMPIFHGFGLGIGIHTALVGGAKCILVPTFSVKAYADLLRKKKPNFIPGVPTLFEALLRTKKLDRLDMSFLKGVFCGGDSLSVELKDKVDRFLKAHNAKVQIREGYGTTECVTASCLTPVDCARESSVGIPFPDMYYKIVKAGTTEELPANTEGEICLSGPTVMLGYLDQPEESTQALQWHPDGKLWLHTGDLGQMDADGFVYFKQRMKRMIISSGYNVYPGQLENIIDRHEKVQFSCVIAVKDPYKIQKAKAYVALKPEYKPSEEIKAELMAYCAERIAKFAMPCDIEFRKDLPRTPVGKVAYRKLEQEAEEQSQ